MPFVIKVNIRHSKTGGTIRTIRHYNNLVYNKIFNSFASTFSFDFYFDPHNQEHAEIICVSHIHECILYYTTNTDPNYQVQETDRELTGYMLANKFKDDGKPQFVKISGYSKPGVLGDCDMPPGQLELDGLTFKEVLISAITPFNLGLVIDKKAAGVNKKFQDKDAVDKADDEVGKTAPDSSQNIASYLSGLAKARNIVLSHNEKGNVWITVPNTKGTPILTLDFTESQESDFKKIPGLEAEMEYNGQALHTHITVIQQADDDEEANGAELPPIKNPLVSGDLYRPKTHVISSGDEFTLQEAANYELGKEIREGVILTINAGTANLKGKLISPNNTIMIRNPRLFLYNLCRWFIQSVTITSNSAVESCTMNCVLPFGYDFDPAGLKNVFVDPHENFPRFR